MMSLADLLPALKDLPHSDKLRAVQFLVIEIAKEEDIALSSGATYPVWSPYNSVEAANTLLSALREDQAEYHA
jgi:hypothetical protein